MGQYPDQFRIRIQRLKSSREKREERQYCCFIHGILFYSGLSLFYYQGCKKGQGYILCGRGRKRERMAFEAGVTLFWLKLFSFPLLIFWPCTSSFCYFSPSQAIIPPSPYPFMSILFYLIYTPDWTHSIYPSNAVYELKALINVILYIVACVILKQGYILCKILF